MDDCIFCKIVAGDIPAEKVYEDQETFAFLDRRPINSGHTLVVPKAHYQNIFDIPADTWAAVMETARRLAPAVRSAAGAAGINIKVNNEREAGQDVFHSHVHIIPRMEGDGHQSWHGTDYVGGAMSAMAQKIKDAQA